MTKIESEDIHIIARHSNWPSESIERTLSQKVYNNADSWKKFLKIFLLTLGLVFTVAGIIFFFAYNWADLNKFAKIGIIQGLITIATLLAMIPKFSITVRNTLLTAASLLVGVLFAVFGQIYQTGANAYDFFLAWSICITIWVLVSNFSPLWMLYLILINTVIFLYSEQVASWNAIELYTLLISVNALFLLSTIFLGFAKKNIPLWFTNTIALALVSFATIGMVVGIFGSQNLYFIILGFITAILYTMGAMYGIQNKRPFYLSIIPFSIIVMISAVFIKISDDAWMFLLTGVFIVASVSYLVTRLIGVQKKWIHEAGN